MDIDPSISDQDLTKLVATLSACKEVHRTLELGMKMRALAQGRLPNDPMSQQITDAEIPLTYWRIMRRHPEFIMQIINYTEPYWSGRDEIEEQMTQALIAVFQSTWAAADDPANQEQMSRVITEVRGENPS